MKEYWHRPRDFLGIFFKNPRVYEDFFELTTPRHNGPTQSNGKKMHQEPAAAQAIVNERVSCPSCLWISFPKHISKMVRHHQRLASSERIEDSSFRHQHIIIITVEDVEETLRLFRQHPVADLAPGRSYVLATPRFG
ncbi:hypothetical protein DAPPUDRAFT_270439 [Daphnia pulex]|uniref:Uncharacterized protein n=1 Tax=Daphnia pulex TaxID=6669 RepID=E9I0R1_DAPPU|nr:hypothetical protein DAPPUDRAFT_270439 [Daphnia pulex]|eukprot:EFX62418.1 hypothetical protein DAPPUDRAFT_270439 [Daphnia pulex]